MESVFLPRHVKVVLQQADDGPLHREDIIFEGQDRLLEGHDSTKDLVRRPFHGLLQQDFEDRFYQT